MGIKLGGWMAPSTYLRWGALLIVGGLLLAVLDPRGGLQIAGIGAVLVIVGLLVKYRGQRTP